jgi:formylglycine-generating enzyme required for sulfatase activity
MERRVSERGSSVGGEVAQRPMSRAMASWLGCVALAACGPQAGNDAPSSASATSPLPSASAASPAASSSAEAPTAQAAASAAVAPPPSAASPTPSPQAGAPDGMVEIAGGSFEFGSEKRKVDVASFWLDPDEVTVAEYKACVELGTGACSEPYRADYCNGNTYGNEAHPINCVDWWQARAYCAAQGKRLPTEYEWEWAARGGAKGNTYPWGNDAPGEQLRWNTWSGGTAPVGSHTAGDAPGGLHDLAGNVWEWTSSLLENGPNRVTRGGSWHNDAAPTVSVRYRNGVEPKMQSAFIGFRCAWGHAPTPQPTQREWDNETIDVGVVGSLPIGCESRKVRDWVRLVCTGGHPVRGIPKDAKVTRSAGPPEDTSVKIEGDRLTALWRFAPGTDLEVDLGFALSSHTLTSRWPTGEAEPVARGTLSNVAGGVAAEVCKACQQASMKRSMCRGKDKNDPLWDNELCTRALVATLQTCKADCVE